MERDTMRLGVTFGAFDLVHAGHVLMFKDAKTVCDHLIVGLHEDPSIERPHKNRPVMSLEERRIILEGCKYIDEIVVYQTEDDLLNILKWRNPDIRIIGSDYIGKEFTGKDVGIPIHYSNRDHGYSSTELRKRIFDAEKIKETPL